MEADGPGGPGGTTWHRFPWGDACPTDFNEVGLIEACKEALWTANTARANCDDSVCHDGFDRSSPVDAFPLGASPEGVLGLAGNTMEWLEDCYHESYAPADGAIPPADGTAWVTQCDLTRRMAHGGSWADTGVNLRASFRGGDLIGEAEDPDVGFRCARDAP